MGSFEDALHCWRRHVGVWSDINSGPLLASGFGAMHMQNCEVMPEAGEYDEVFDKPGYLHIGYLSSLIPFARQED